MFTFQFLNDKIDQNTNFAKLPIGKMTFFDITVNFIIKKLKSKHLALSVFSGQRFFWGNERKYFPHIPGLVSSSYKAFHAVLYQLLRIHQIILRFLWNLKLKVFLLLFSFESDIQLCTWGPLMQNWQRKKNEIQTKGCENDGLLSNIQFTGSPICPRYCWC